MDALINPNKEAIKFVFVVGPTASGKSSWAYHHALRLNGSILNIDSVQCYQGLNIGSASPKPHERLQVPHYLYSYVTAPTEMTAGQYLRDFYQLMQSQKLQSPVFIVGGTGFYIQALQKGMYDVEPTDSELRKSIEIEIAEGGAKNLFAELSAADPQHLIHINDHYRIGRAVEVLRGQQKTPTELKCNSKLKANKNAFPFPCMSVGFSLSKDYMLPRVQARTKWMIENGLIEETESFLDQGFHGWSPLSSVGYKETVDYLLHNKSKHELFESIVISTIKLIKKQKTWFKRDTSIHWSDYSADSLAETNLTLDQYLTAIDPSPLAK